MKQQIFAAGRWQDYDENSVIDILPEEKDAAEAGQLPVRTLVSEQKRLRIAGVMTLPSLCHSASMHCIREVFQEIGDPLFEAYGVFYHHGLTRAIQKALDWRDDKGNGADFVVTIDFDSIFTFQHVRKLVELAAQHPEADVIVPLQQKREGGEVLATTEGPVNLKLPLVPIKTGHFGLTLIRRSVFERIPKPWFTEIPDENGEWGEGRTDPDIYFWGNARKVGVNAFMAPGVHLGHKQQVITWAYVDETGRPKVVNQFLNDWENTKTPPMEALS